MRRCLLLLAVPCLAFAPAPFPKHGDRSNDVRQLQGTWMLESENLGDKVLPAREYRAVFSGRKLFLGGARWEITASNADARPKAMDLRTSTAKEGQYLLLNVIYSLEGDTLKICYDSANWRTRPKDWSLKGTYHHLRVLKRKKP
jgi:uncharacterized protein (TIGR03067 family)